LHKVTPSLQSKGGEKMVRFASGLMGGIAVGMIIGAGAILTTDEKSRRRMMKKSRRNMKRASAMLDEIF